MCTEAWQGEYEHNNMFSLSLWRISANLKRFVKGNVISWTLLVRQRFHLCRAAFAVDWTLLFFTRCCPCIAQSSPHRFVTDRHSSIFTRPTLIFTRADWRDILSLGLSQIITVRLSALASSLFSAFKLNRHYLDSSYMILYTCDVDEVCMCVLEKIKEIIWFPHNATRQPICSYLYAARYNAVIKSFLVSIQLKTLRKFNSNSQFFFP